jgi:hypothetical protein
MVLGEPGHSVSLWVLEANFKPSVIACHRFDDAEKLTAWLYVISQDENCFLEVALVFVNFLGIEFTQGSGVEHVQRARMPNTQLVAIAFELLEMEEPQIDYALQLTHDFLLIR